MDFCLDSGKTPQFLCIEPRTDEDEANPWTISALPSECVREAKRTRYVVGKRFLDMTPLSLSPLSSLLSPRNNEIAVQRRLFLWPFGASEQAASVRNEFGVARELGGRGVKTSHRATVLEIELEIEPTLQLQADPLGCRTRTGNGNRGHISLH